MEEVIQPRVGEPVTDREIAEHERAEHRRQQRGLAPDAAPPGEQGAPVDPEEEAKKVGEVAGEEKLEFPPSHLPGISSKRNPFKYSVSGSVVTIG